MAPICTPPKLESGPVPSRNGDRPIAEERPGAAINPAPAAAAAPRKWRREVSRDFGFGCCGFSDMAGLLDRGGEGKTSALRGWTITVVWRGPAIKERLRRGLPSRSGRTGEAAGPARRPH